MEYHPNVRSPVIPFLIKKNEDPAGQERKKSEINQVKTMGVN